MTILTTRTGDAGITSIGKTRVSKLDPLIRIMGLLDHTQAIVGSMHSYDFHYPQVREYTDIICNDLYTIMGMIHIHGYLSADQIKPFIEHLDKIIETIIVPKVNVFVRPNKLTCVANKARAECRLNEIALIKLENNSNYDKSVSTYLNRLSSVLYGMMIHIDYCKSNIYKKTAGIAALYLITMSVVALIVG